MTTLTTPLANWLHELAITVDFYDEFATLHQDRPLSDRPAIEVYDDLLHFIDSDIFTSLPTQRRDYRLIIRATAEALRNSWADRVFPPPDPDSAASFDECERAGIDGTLRSL